MFRISRLETQFSCCHVILDFMFHAQNGNEICTSRMTEACDSQEHVTPPPPHVPTSYNAAFLSDGSFSEVVCSLLYLSNDMKVLFLLALVALAAAFDFPEDWEAWKKVVFTSGVRCSTDYHPYHSLVFPFPFFCRNMASSTPVKSRSYDATSLGRQTRSTSTCTTKTRTNSATRWK